MRRFRSNMAAQAFPPANSDLFGESGPTANVWVAASDGDMDRVKELVQARRRPFVFFFEHLRRFLALCCAGRHRGERG